MFFCSSKTTTTGTINCNSTATVSINEFLDITVNATKEEARVVLKRAQGIEAAYPLAPEKTLWHSCVDSFYGTVFTFNMVLDHTNKPSPDDIHTWISASLTNVDMCEEGFETMNITATMLPGIRAHGADGL
ncbi:putative pectinesterase inhibitor domain-containing protein [Helianthus anomalus]